MSSLLRGQLSGPFSRNGGSAHLPRLLHSCRRTWERKCSPSAGAPAPVGSILIPLCFRSQQRENPLAGKDGPADSDLAIAPGGNLNPEAHLPSICLKQVFPKYAQQFNYLRLVDRMANLFIRFLGIKGTTKLGPTGFRTFIRSVRPAPSMGFGQGGVQPHSGLV